MATLGLTEPELEPSPREFKRWHLPRKQYVRSKQWLAEIVELSQDLNLDGGLLKYLTLPGEDLLDIRHLHDGLCSAKGIRLRYLGFSRSAQPGNEEHAVFTTNQAAVRLLPFIDEGSDTLYCDLKSIGVHTSTARQTITRAGAFHAINIDLCGGFARGGIPQSEDNLFKALEALLEIQGRANRDSLLFITMRVDGNQVATDVRAQFDGLLLRNFEDCRAFADEVARVWQLDEREFRGPSVSELGENDRFLLGFVKWVIAAAVRYRLSTTLRSVLTYQLRPDGGEDDLASIVLRLSPIHQLGPDPLGMTGSADPAPIDGWECKLASKIPARVFHRKSVDEKLRRDPDLMELCCRETETLLGAVGYSSSSYRSWLAEGGAPTGDEAGSAEDVSPR